MPTHNKHIFVRLKILGSGGFRILGIVYTVDSSIRIGLFVYNFRKKFSDLKNVSSIFNEFFVCKIFLIFKFEKIKNVALHNFSKILKMSRKRLNVEKIQAIYFPKSSFSPNKHIFVRAKRVCLLWEKC